MLQCHSAHKVETLVIWKLGGFILKKKLEQLVVMVRDQVVLKDPNIMLDGTKQRIKKKYCVKLNNMYESN